MEHTIGTRLVSSRASNRGATSPNVGRRGQSNRTRGGVAEALRCQIRDPRPRPIDQVEEGPVTYYGTLGIDRQIWRIPGYIENMRLLASVFVSVRK